MHVALSPELDRKVVGRRPELCVVHGRADARVVGHREDGEEDHAGDEQLRPANFDPVGGENAQRFEDLRARKAS